MGGEKFLELLHINKSWLCNVGVAKTYLPAERVDSETKIQFLLHVK